MITDNQRPGVYSVYDTTSAYLSPRSAGYAAVAARARGGETGRLYTFTTLAQLNEAFDSDTEETALHGCVGILLRSGVSRVLAVKVEEDYGAAFALLEEEENIGVILCDSGEEDILLDLKDSVLRSSQAQRERVAFCGAEDPALALELAGELNSERMALCCPAAQCEASDTAKAVYGAAALAGKTLAGNDPAHSFNGEALELIALPQRLSESQVQALLKGGVTVLEECGGVAECVRAVTTKTKTGGDTDYSMRGLNTILCIDDVMGHVRAALRATLRGGRVSGSPVESIRSQTVVALADRQDAGILESYDPPKCRADSADPTVCIVELSFRVAHVLSQIHITAHIQV